MSNGLEVRLACINNYVVEGFPLRVGDELFVLGYPKGIEIGDGLPIWKRATVASEPPMLVNDQPIILIDTATRQGMSGGLVIARQTRGTTSLPRGQLTLLSGEVCRFVGVYTSRDAGDSEFDAQLGRVWTREHLHDVLTTSQIELARL